MTRIKVTNLVSQVDQEVVTTRQGPDLLAILAGVPPRWRANSAPIETLGRVDCRASFTIARSEISKLTRTNGTTWVAGLPKFNAEDDKGFRLEGCIVLSAKSDLGGPWRAEVVCDMIIPPPPKAPPRGPILKRMIRRIFRTKAKAEESR